FISYVHNYFISIIICFLFLILYLCYFFFFLYFFFIFFFFFNDTATTEIYTLSLHDALPISVDIVKHFADGHEKKYPYMQEVLTLDRKSTRLNSSHDQISYAVFCLKKKKKKKNKII